MTEDIDRNEEVLLHVHDLPQIYTRPSYEQLLGALALLKLQPFSFSGTGPALSNTQVDPSGVPHYLTSIVSSSLSWLQDDVERETVWENASARLSERAGRSAMPSMTRSFHISDELVIELYEPSLTEDNLGLKTWTSSLLLARRLLSLARHIPVDCSRVLELGSGTGLVGIACSVLWNLDVVLSDLPQIVPNLQKNVTSNMDLLKGTSRSLSVRSLDWSNVNDSPQTENERVLVVVAADPIYSADHPQLLVNAVSRWICNDTQARFITELPLRKGYEEERSELRSELTKARMELIVEGTETGYDDWHGPDGRPAEVECWWSVWRPSSDRVTF